MRPAMLSWTKQQDPLRSCSSSCVAPHSMTAGIRPCSSIAYATIRLHSLHVTAHCSEPHTVCRHLQAQQVTPALAAIAIIGTSARLPSGICLKDPISAVPLDRWDADSSAMPAAAGSRFGGFVADWAGFDAQIFGIAPSEAAVMDPQQRLLLEVRAIDRLIHLHCVTIAFSWGVHGAVAF